MTSTQSYVADTITTASPTQLVLMMYDGALQALRRADVAGDQDAAPADAMATTFDRELDRCTRILAELRNVLDHERGGEIAQNLDSLYTFCIDLLGDAVELRSADPLNAVTEIVTTLRQTWAEAVC